MGAKKQGHLLLNFIETISYNKRQDSYRFVYHKGIKITCATVQKLLCEGGHKTACVPGSHQLPYTGSKWSIGILEMIVFETAKSGMDNGISDTEYVLPEVMILGVCRNQWDHSNAGKYKSTD
ncbi:hypothetical protein [Acidaminococcus timonensis]|jgi:hypothetical protein|uniref:hypothetical protein n=1 Tax=Acidaminococcus timonensis TaxID=1871002 RepID=UPI003A5C5E97